jgi:hypothetical protein
MHVNHVENQGTPLSKISLTALIYDLSRVPGFDLDASSLEYHIADANSLLAPSITLYGHEASNAKLKVLHYSEFIYYVIADS